MAKIEKPSCFFDDNLEKIVELCNGIMVARGDLGVECTLSKFYPCAFTLVCCDTHITLRARTFTSPTGPPEDVPILQKNIIDECRSQGKPVVVGKFGNTVLYNYFSCFE